MESTAWFGSSPGVRAVSLPPGPSRRCGAGAAPALCRERGALPV